MIVGQNVVMEFEVDEEGCDEGSGEERADVTRPSALHPQKSPKYSSHSTLLYYVVLASDGGNIDTIVSVRSINFIIREYQLAAMLARKNEHSGTTPRAPEPGHKTEQCQLDD